MRLVPSHLAPHWMERQDLGQGAFLSLISGKFFLGRSGVARTVFVVPWWEADMEKNPLGGFMWLLLEPTDLSESCQCSHLLP